MNEPTPPITDDVPRVEHAFALLVERMRDLIAAGVRSEATLCMHREHIRFLSEHLDVRTPLAAVDAKVLESLAHVEAQGRRESRSGERRRISGGTLRKRLCTLRLALQLSRRRGWIERVPEFPDVAYRYRPRRNHLRSWGEFERLASALPLERREWIYVATFTAQHPRDVELMRAYDDADPFASPPWMILCNRKNRRDDGVKVEMPAPLAEVLRARFERERLAPGAPLVEPWDKDERCRVLRATAERLQLPHTTAMALRRTSASWAAHELGTITRGLQEWLGHNSLEMLQRVYARALEPGLQDVAAALTAAARRPPKSSDRGDGAPKRNGPNRVSPRRGQEPTEGARQHRRGRMGISTTGR